MRSGLRFFLKTHNVFCWVPRWLTGDFSWIMLMSHSRMPGSILSTGFGGPLPWKWLPCLCRAPLGSWLMQPLVLWKIRRDVESFCHVFCRIAPFWSYVFWECVQFQGSQVLELIAWAIQWLNFGSQRNLSLDRRDAFPQANDRAGLTDRIWIPLEQNRSGGPVSGCILWGPLVWLVLGTAMDRMCNATRCCPSAVAKTNLWHVFVSFLTRSCAFTSVECAVFVCIWVAQPLAIAARGCCVLRWHAVRLAVSMGLSTNQLRIRFFAEYLRLALGILPNSLWIMNTHSREIVNQHSNNQLVQWDGWRGSNPIHTL